MSATMSALEACDLLRFATSYLERLEDAAAVLMRHPPLVKEREWLEAAKGLVSESAAPSERLLERARSLPELPELRAERAGAAQGEWVDALEKLLAGITFHVSGRAPIIEALYPHQKLQPLRKAAREACQKFMADFEKRLKSSYVSRMMASEDFAFAVPVVERVRASFESWMGCYGDGGLTPEEARALRAELAEAGAAVERSVRQARLLAEAALVPVPGAYEDLQLAQKPKKRVSKAVEAESAPVEAGSESAEGSEAVVEPEAAVAASAEPEVGAEAQTEAPSPAPEAAAPKKRGRPAKAKPAEESAPAEVPASAAEAVPAESPAPVEGEAVSAAADPAATAPAKKPRAPRKAKAAAASSEPVAAEAPVEIAGEPVAEAAPTADA